MVIECFLKNVVVKVMFTFIVFEILLLLLGRYYDSHNMLQGANALNSFELNVLIEWLDFQ